MDMILFIHILSATAWIGGSILLFGLGIALRDKKAQEEVYGHIGPFYGYFETIWLVLLISTGLWLLWDYSLVPTLFQTPLTDIGRILWIKLSLVGILTIATIIHMVIALKTHKKERTLTQKMVSRGSSMLIFILNLAILWYAIQIRSII